LAETGWHQLSLAVLTIIVFLLEIVPLELQRRIINDLVKDRHFQVVIVLCGAYASTVLVQGAPRLSSTFTEAGSVSAPRATCGVRYISWSARPRHRHRRWRPKAFRPR